RVRGRNPLHGAVGLDGDRRARARAARRGRSFAPAEGRGAARVPDAEHRRGRSARAPARGPDRARSGPRPDRLLLRAGDERRDPRRARIAGSGPGPGRAAPPHPRVHGALPGLLLRSGAGRAAGRRGWQVTVVVLGGGPAGLAAAVELRRRDTREVLVVERETEPGGIPRHAQHQGFGVRDLRRPLSGPAYARRYAQLAAAAGAEIRTETMVTGWSPGGPLELTGPSGREAIEPDALVLATGCRERPRSARLVPGSRPEGVLTTGT